MLEKLKMAAEAAKIQCDTKRRAYVGALSVRTDGAVVVSRNGSATSICPQLHAEARAARKAGIGAVYYVARLKKDGSYGLAKPCNRCMSLLKNKRAKLIVYTIDNENWGAIVP